MKKLILLLTVLLFAGTAQAQQILNSTTTNGVLTRNQTTITLTSATVNIANGAAAFSPGLAVGQEYVIADGNGLEAGMITAINGVVISVTRGVGGTKAYAHASGAVIFFGLTNSFFNGPPGSTTGTDPGSACTRATLRILPMIDLSTGLIWTCGSQGSPATASTWSAVLPSLGQSGTVSTGWLR